MPDSVGVFMRWAEPGQGHGQHVFGAISGSSVLDTASMGGALSLEESHRAAEVGPHSGA
jgi:hypothetical protein